MEIILNWFKLRRFPTLPPIMSTVQSTFVL